MKIWNFLTHICRKSSYLTRTLSCAILRLCPHQPTPTNCLTLANAHVPISITFKDNLTNEPTFLKDSNPKTLVQLFVEELAHRQTIISKQVWSMYPMIDANSIPKRVQCTWMDWVNQFPVFDFNSRKYDLNLVKEHFVKMLSDISDVENGWTTITS